MTLRKAGMPAHVFWEGETYDHTRDLTGGQRRQRRPGFRVHRGQKCRPAGHGPGPSGPGGGDSRRQRPGRGALRPGAGGGDGRPPDPDFRAQLRPWPRASGKWRPCPTPVGRVLRTVQRPNGMVIEKTSVPMGVIAIIYESRPNVTSDAAALALKAGSACVLRGGKESYESNAAIVAALRAGLAEAGLPGDLICLVEDTTRASSTELMTANGLVDLLIPRGGAGLIRAVVENASVPLHPDGHRHLPHLCGRRRGPGQSPGHRGETPKPAAPRCATPRRSAWSTGKRRRISCRCCTAASPWSMTRPWSCGCARKRLPLSRHAGGPHGF